MNLEIANPLQGAAWQVLFARAVPHTCTTRERQAEIAADFAATLEWADTQGPDVAKAYRWASASILSDIERLLKQNELGQAVTAALATIPRPPEKAA